MPLTKARWCTSSTPRTARVHRRGIADVAGDEFDVAFDLLQAPRRAARIVVEHAHGVAVLHQRLDQRGADEAAAAGDQNANSRPLLHDVRLGIEPAAAVVCTAGGVEQGLDTIAFGKAGRPRAGRFDRIEEGGREARDRCDPAVGGKCAVHGIVDLDRGQRRGRAPCHGSV